MSTALETKGLQKQFGGLIVTRDLSLKLEAGARHALIGPNGAGKTTVINLLTGVLSPNGGGLPVSGDRNTRFSAHQTGAGGAAPHIPTKQTLYGPTPPRNNRGSAVQLVRRRGDEG